MHASRLAQVALIVAAGACVDRFAPQTPDDSTGSPDPPLAPVPTFGLVLQVMNEDGAPVAGATVTAPSLAGAAGPLWQGTTDADGRVALYALTQPLVYLVAAGGYLTEPVVLGRESAGEVIVVRILRERSATGERRVVMHFGGDVMMGRRFIEPTLETTAVVQRGDGGGSARRVVSAIAPLFRAADLRSVNLETVVGENSPDDAYPRKRFLLQSPPEVLYALDELGVNVVTLGNNHLRDWLEPGVRSTLTLLDQGGHARVGAGLDAESAAVPLIIDAAEHSIAMLSFTSVNGDFVNDNLPDAGAPEPADLNPEERWQYELRTFSFFGPTVSIPERPQRIGEVWRDYKAAESGLSESERVSYWSRASLVFPELQDWVSRRGHGGARPYSRAAMMDQVESLRAQGHDLVIVQYHSGFQFFEAKSTVVTEAAHDAIDAGADLVVAHHPHVLQGLEWYKGRLIAYSLGNFVFDQDFLSTFGSLVLRVVMEGRNTLQVRLFPVVLADYRPAAVTGEAAAHILRGVEEYSAQGIVTDRVDEVVRRILEPLSTDSTPPLFRYEHNSARLDIGAPTTFTQSVLVASDGLVDLDGTALTRSRAAGGGSMRGVAFARDLFREGTFEDELADGIDAGGTHWVVNDSYKRIEVLASSDGAGSSDGDPASVRGLRLRRTTSNTDPVQARLRARVPLAPQRFYQRAGSGLIRADGDATYSLRFRAKLTGDGKPYMRFSVYNFYDIDPTADPLSTLLASASYLVDVPSDGAWHDILFEIPPEIFQPVSGLEVNALLFYVGLTPPTSDLSALVVDDLALLEWREADLLPDGFWAFEAMRALPGHGSVTAEVERFVR